MANFSTKTSNRVKIIGIIPARFASTRFPGKPLIDIGGKSMIQRVYEQAAKTNCLSDVYVATDDDRIHQHVQAFGGKSIMTSNKHESGTDRCSEVIGLLSVNYDVAINIQGDEPFIDPSQIALLASCFNAPNTDIATLVKKIDSEQDLFNTNIPKVVLNSNAEAIYFSRQTIPYIRGEEQQNWLASRTFYKHIGIYGFKTSILKQLTLLPQSSLEKSEALEQLRWLENGYRIKVAITEIENVAIDSPEDLNKIHRFL
jgi:3-deoxy-manno-octulosonate cytidylyltransferase (CMP-KDO synthetase)